MPRLGLATAGEQTDITASVYIGQGKVILAMVAVNSEMYLTMMNHELYKLRQQINLLRE